MAHTGSAVLDQDDAAAATARGRLLFPGVVDLSPAFTHVPPGAQRWIKHLVALSHHSPPSTAVPHPLGSRGGICPWRWAVSSGSTVPGTV